MEKLVLTPQETAKLLSTSHDTVRKLLLSGEIPAYREGRNWKIPRSGLIRYIEDRTARETSARREQVNA